MGAADNPGSEFVWAFGVHLGESEALLPAEGTLDQIYSSSRALFELGFSGEEVWQEVVRFARAGLEDYLRPHLSGDLPRRETTVSFLRGRVVPPAAPLPGPEIYGYPPPPPAKATVPPKEPPANAKAEPAPPAAPPATSFEHYQTNTHGGNNEAAGPKLGANISSPKASAKAPGPPLKAALP